MKLLVKNIARIVGIESTGRLRCCGADMNRLDTLDDAWLLADNGRFAAFGRMDSLGDIAADEVVDAEGGMLFPSFCDSHTHLVYAGSREREFLDKINGLSYEEIARRGGGILNSADLLHATPEDELYAQAMERVREIAAMGTGCVEIKSGYGLTTEDELKMLRVIGRIRESVPLEVRATFLGAHAVARAYRGRQGGVRRPGVPRDAARRGGRRAGRFRRRLLRRRFFSRSTRRPASSRPRANWACGRRFMPTNWPFRAACRWGVACDALSVDHLERMGAEEIEALHGTATMPTLLPGAAFFLRMSYPPARAMIDAGLGVALASDYNPGSSPSGNMRMVCSLASIRMKMTPAEAVNAATLNGAYAMGLSRDYGSVTLGKVANFFITKPMPSVEFFLLRVYYTLIRHVFLKGGLGNRF